MLAIDNTMAVSKKCTPVRLMAEITYSLGILAFSNASRLGSREVGLVVSSCACKSETEKRKDSKTMVLRKSRCMVFYSVWKIYPKESSGQSRPKFNFAGKLKGNIESVLLKNSHADYNLLIWQFYFSRGSFSTCSLVFPNLLSRCW